MNWEGIFMLNYQAMKEAIEAFQPGGANSPILYSTLAVNERGFKALLGRNTKQRPIYGILLICLFVFAAATIITAISPSYTGSSSFASFVPIYVIIFLTRTTLVSVGDNSIDFYFVESRRGRKFVAYEKISLPYDKITNVKARTGRFNTRITFEFSIEGKSYKISATVPNKDKKANEQAENLRSLLAAVNV
jgi:hypothetical protein